MEVSRHQSHTLRDYLSLFEIKVRSQAHNSGQVTTPSKVSLGHSIKSGGSSSNTTTPQNNVLNIEGLEKIDISSDEQQQQQVYSDETSKVLQAEQ